MTLTGYDISNNNGNLDLAAYEADFWIMKATEGTYFTDSYCDGFMNKAKALGKLTGVYHFMSNEDPTAQAEYFFNAIRGYIGQSIIILDFEANGLQLGSAGAKTFMDHLQSLAGVKPLIYMSASVTSQFDWTATVQADYALWVAAYSDSEPSVTYWPNYAMWQHTSTPLDHNYFYGDANAWNAYAGIKAQATPSEPLATPKPVSAPSHVFAHGVGETVAFGGLYTDSESASHGRGENYTNQTAIHSGTITQQYNVNNVSVYLINDGAGFINDGDVSASAPTASRSYTIQSGDTLSGIAAYLGVSMTDLQNANGIADANTIYAGQVLNY